MSSREELAVQLDPNDLLAFLALARTRTHLAAAEALGVNHTTVARRVRSLQSALGVELVEPSRDGWSLTSAGKATLPSAEAIERALADVAGVETAPTDTTLRGLVRVNATEVFGVMVAAPALSTLRSQHPSISVELTCYTGPGANYATPVDLDVGILKPRAASLVVRRLPDCLFGLYAGKRYLVNRSAPSVLDDLDEHTTLYFIDSMPRAEREATNSVADTLTKRGSQVIGAASVFAQMEMIRYGAGIGTLPVYLADQQRDLVRVLPNQAEFAHTYWLSGRAENFVRPEVQAVCEAIEQRARALLDHQTRIRQ